MTVNLKTDYIYGGEHTIRGLPEGQPYRVVVDCTVVDGFVLTAARPQYAKFILRAGFVFNEMHLWGGGDSDIDIGTHEVGSTIFLRVGSNVRYRAQRWRRTASANGPCVQVYQGTSVIEGVTFASNNGKRLVESLPSPVISQNGPTNIEFRNCVGEISGLAAGSAGTARQYSVQVPTPGDYTFTAYVGSTAYNFWFNNGGEDPGNPNQFEVNLSGATDDEAVASAFRTTINGSSLPFTATVSGNTVTVTHSAVGAHESDPGGPGFTVTMIAAGSNPAPNGAIYAEKGTITLRNSDIRSTDSSGNRVDVAVLSPASLRFVDSLGSGSSGAIRTAGGGTVTNLRT